LKIATLPARIAVRLIGAFGFGFFLSMFTRSVANVIKHPLQTELVLTEEALSLAIGTSFFVAFGLMQLPLGVLLDRYDPRRVNTALFSLAGVGGIIFAMADSAPMLALGRVLMGVGFAGGMMATMKTYAMWFPAEKLATLHGIQFAIGVVGAVSATLPTHYLLHTFTWREITLGFAGLTFVAAALYMLIAPKHAAPPSGESLGTTLRGIGKVYTDRYFWRVMPVVSLTTGISQGIGTLYVFPWLVHVADYPENFAATVLSATAMISAINFLFMGPLSEWLARRYHWSPMRLPITGVVVAMGVMLVLVLQWTAIAPVIWLLWTLSMGMNVLSFAAISRAFPLALSGRAITAINLTGFGFTAIAQWAIGRTLDLFPGDFDTGYQVAFAILLGVQALGMAWYLLATRIGYGTRTMVERQTEEPALA
jgi:MFS family permease